MTTRIYIYHTQTMPNSASNSAQIRIGPGYVEGWLNNEKVVRRNDPGFREAEESNIAEVLVELMRLDSRIPGDLDKWKLGEIPPQSVEDN